MDSTSSLSYWAALAFVCWMILAGGVTAGAAALTVFVPLFVEAVSAKHIR